VPDKFINLARHDPAQLGMFGSLARLGPNRSSSLLDPSGLLGPFVSLGLPDQFVLFGWPKPAGSLGRLGTSRLSSQLGLYWSLRRSGLSGSTSQSDPSRSTGRSGPSRSLGRSDLSRSLGPFMSSGTLDQVCVDGPTRPGKVVGLV